MSKISPTPDVFAGDIFIETLTLKNVGSETAERVQLVFEIEYPFAMVNKSTNIFIGKISQGKSKSVSITISIDGWALVGVYNIVFNIQWEDSVGVTYTQSNTFNVQISGRPKIDIQETVLDQGPSKISAGDSLIKVLNLKNVGIEEAKVVQVSLNITYPFALISSSSNLLLGDLGIGENRSVSIEISVDRNAIGVYSIPFTITYEDSYGWIFKKFGAFGVEVLGKPLMLIRETVTSEKESNVFIGDAFNKIFNLTNVGGYDTKRVQLSLNVFYPFTLTQSGSNVFFGDLDVGESKFISVQFSVDRNAPVGVYSIPFTITYENYYGEKYIRDGIFGVELIGKPQLLIEEITIDPSPMALGQSGLMNMKITNIGTDMAHDTSIRIFGSGNIVSSSFAYIAKIKEKDSESIVFPLSVDNLLKPGNYLMNISISYSDYVNNTYYLSKLHELRVFENSFVVPPFYIGLVAAVAALSFFGYMFYSWRPEDVGIEAKDSEHVGVDELKPKRKKGRFIILLLAVIVMYITIFPIPYIVHTNLDNAGIVIKCDEVDIQSLPRDVQEVCRLRGINKPLILLVKHVEPEWVTMVITSEKLSVGTLVEMSDYIINWFVDWRDFNFADRPFDKFVVSNVKKLGYFESLFEKIILVQERTISIYDLSKVTFYGGPIIFILCLTLFTQKRLALWNLPAVFSCYSFQIWCSNTLADIHRISVTLEMKYFGYLFVALIPIAVYAWHFERSSGGRSTAYKMKELSSSLGLLWE